MIANQGLAELYDEALERWGVDAQMMMAIEEMTELINAISKAYRKGLHDCNVQKNIIEEYADTYIMLEQLEVIFTKHLGSDFYDRVMEKRHKKLSRLRELLLHHDTAAPSDSPTETSQQARSGETGEGRSREDEAVGEFGNGRAKAGAYERRQPHG